jgi:acylphosphatase
MPSLPSLHVVVAGRVQGVGFRWFVQREAERLGIAGWVRNLPDGRVEMEAFGERAALDDLLRRVRQGPAGSHVAQVVEEWREVASPPAVGFHIRRDA